MFGCWLFFFQAEDGIRDIGVTGVQTCALPILDWSWVGEFKKAGWLEPVEMSKEDLDDMKTTSTFSVEEKVYAVPYSNDYRIAYYNKAMYDKAGISEAPKTWDQVIENAKVLKEKNIVKYPVDR